MYAAVSSLLEGLDQNEINKIISIEVTVVSGGARKMSGG